MKNLERVQFWTVGPRTMIDRGHAIAAARLDCEAARAEGYRQGVEDGESRRLLRIAHGEIQQACVKYISLKFYTVKDFVRRRRIESMKMHMRAAIELRNRAFRGARGVKRAEIRQRLEEMEQGK